jgi:hypothetical protein
MQRRRPAIAFCRQACYTFFMESFYNIYKKGKIQRPEGQKGSKYENETGF